MIITILLIGLLLLWFYGLRKGFHLTELIRWSLSGSLRAKNVYVILTLLGILTGLWRANGTIAYIVTTFSRFFIPQVILCIFFLVNCAVSFITGSSFGTAATMGSICMTIAYMMELDPIWAGGAILSGSYFGDRFSPLSSSAALVATATDTDLNENLKQILRTTPAPFVLTCLIYTAVSLFQHTNPVSTSSLLVFANAFTLNLWCLLPAILVVILALFQMPVKYNLLINILLSVAIACFVQSLPAAEVFQIAFGGFQPTDPSLATISGGGFLSMFRVILIVFIASSFSELFERTGIVKKLSSGIAKLGSRTTPFASVMLFGILCCMLSCNQALPTLLLASLCKEAEPDTRRLALYIENSTVVMAALVPWSIASTAPLSSIGAPTRSILTACFLYLVPLCYLLIYERKAQAN